MPVTVSPAAAISSPIRGVQFNAPPDDIIPSITASIDKAMKSLRPGEDGAIVGLADGKGGANAALVLRVPHGFEVYAWIGKNWSADSDVEWGAAIRKSITFRKT